MKIYINPGHSVEDPGAVGYETERRLNVAVSRYMAAYLLDHYNCQVRITADELLTLSEVCSDANRWGADLFVSNHFNAGGGDGYEALVYNQSRVSLGKLFETQVLAAGQNSRGVKLRPELAVLKNTAMPAIVNEGAFVDNLQDISQWNEAHELQLLGEAYAKAAAVFLKLEEKYTLRDFVYAMQRATGSEPDGIAGPETLRNTVTVSAYKNRTHPVVKPVQQRLLCLGYIQVGAADGIAGAKFTQAVQAFQQDNGCVADGELTARNKTWRKLLGLE
jgi:N-acetylmuramoyl-L-alanine amidase